MKIHQFVLLLLFISAQAAAQSTSHLVLQSQNHPRKHKQLPLRFEYTFYTDSTTFFLDKIIGYTDSSLQLVGSVKTGRDTLVRQSFRDKATKKWKDSLVLSAMYHVDTFQLPFSGIRKIERDWFRSRGWMLPFAYFAGGAILGLVLGPVAIINKGKEGLHDWLRFEALLTGLSVPVLFIGSRSHKYDLRQKWKLVVLHDQ